MEKPYMTFSHFLLLFSLLSTAAAHRHRFFPVDNHLISCGSPSTTTITVNNRRFISDESNTNTNSPLFSSTRSTPLSDPNPDRNSPKLYHSARVFERPLKYAFEIRDRGTHMVRLHFHPFVSTLGLDLSVAKFHVLVDGYVVLTNISVAHYHSVVKEYFVWLDPGTLEITFLPSRIGGLGFVNAIEVISAPKDLIADVATYVGGDNVERFGGLTHQALETVYRVNVGGPKVTPFNDSVWRTWVPDDPFFKSNSLSRKVYFSGRVNYQDGRASREVGPDFVYASARLISSTSALVANVNMTWEFPVVEGFNYLVRLHFCDIASISLGLLYFNVYVNGYLAYYNLDLSATMYILASPFYADFMVDGGSSGILSVSVGPSNKSLGYAIDGMLNGVEIMKLNNSMGSLDGTMCAGMVLKSVPKGNGGIMIPLLAFVCLVLSVSMFARRMFAAKRDSFAWTKLPTSINGDQPSLGKV